MDRYLLLGAISLLSLELYIFFSDHLWTKLDPNFKAKEPYIVGHVIKKNQSVRIKQGHTIAWQDAESNDALQAYDSILTLDNSSAQIHLNSDIHITLYENTLIVLEPHEENSKLEFKEGLMVSRVKQKSLTLGSENWTIEAKPGTDFSLKGNDESQLAIEVKKGDVRLENSLSKKVHYIGNNTLLKTTKNDVSEIKNLSESLQWQNNEHRVYSHIFPLNLKLQWMGNADVLEINYKDNKTVKSDINHSTSLDHLAEPGTYQFRLFGEGQSASKELIVEVLKAPEIKYFSPLPRERFHIQSNINFAWSPLANVREYAFEISTDENYKNVHISKKTISNYLNLFINENLNLFWRIKAIDNDGFIIPPLYNYPLFTSDEPFAPPEGIEFNVRTPASEKQNIKKSKKPTLINHIWNLVLPQAYAETSPSREVLFQWKEIEGADFYIIEISSQANFLNPEINTKVQKNRFIWHEDFKHERYYMRIAAGDEMGRIGIFSEPQLIHIKEIETTIKIVKTKNSLESQINYIKPIDGIESPSFDFAPTQSVKPNIREWSQTEFTDPTFLMQWSYNLSYQWESLKLVDDFTYKFEEPSPVNFHGLVMNQRWLFQSHIQYNQWLINENEYPFQNKSDFYNFTVSLNYRWHTSHYLGFNFLYKNLPIRESYEAVKMKAYNLMGINYAYSKFYQHWSTLFQVNASFVKDLSILALQYRYQWKVTWVSDNLMLGPQIDLQYIKSTAMKGYMIQPSLLLGWEW